MLSFWVYTFRTLWLVLLSVPPSGTTPLTRATVDPLIRFMDDSLEMKWTVRFKSLQSGGREGEMSGGDGNGDGDGDGDGTHGKPSPPPPPPTWGLTEAALRDLDDNAAVSDWAFLEVHARLCKLYPSWTISHMPVHSLQERPPEIRRRHQTGDEDGDGDGGDVGKYAAGSAGGDTDDDVARSGDDDGRGRHHCDVFVANAAVHGDGFRWHVDADPSSFPTRCPWTDAHGEYVNGMDTGRRETGKQGNGKREMGNGRGRFRV